MDVAVLGAGVRGRAVARQCVRAGHDVGLYADDANAVMDSVDAIDRALPDVDATDHVTGTTGLAGAVEGAAVVVDTTDGDVDSRRELVAEVETLLADDALVATGDMGVSVTAVAAGLRRPARAVGFQFVDPEDSDIVEVVLADQTTRETRDRAVAFVEGLDCVPVVVADSPGFAAARLELARICEAIRTVEAGVASVPDIDRAATRGDDRRGPLARADEMGLDTVLAGLKDLEARLGDRFAPPELLERAVESGQLGRGTGTGFYVWSDGDPETASDLVPDGPTVDDDTPHR